MTALGGEPRALGGERGAGSVLGVGIVAAVLTVLVLLVAVASALLVRHRVEAAADSAALAAADTLLGGATGVPCERAAEVAEALSIHLDACSVQGAEARTTASATVLGLRVEGDARAGPEPSAPVVGPRLR